MTHGFFELAFGVIFLAFMVIRVYYHWRARRTQGQVEYLEGKWNRLIRVMLAFPFLGLLSAYVVSPGVLAWAAWPAPVWARWLGLALGIASLLLLWWTHRALGSNFSGNLHVREEHTLVTHGPYRWVRHPMYTAFHVQAIGFLLLTANWVVGGVYLVAVALVVITRLPREEAAMLGKFGDAYRAYMARTGRLLPRIV